MLLYIWFVVWSVTVIYPEFSILCVSRDLGQSLAVPYQQTYRASVLLKVATYPHLNPKGRYTPHTIHLLQLVTGNTFYFMIWFRTESSKKTRRKLIININQSLRTWCEHWPLSWLSWWRVKGDGAEQYTLHFNTIMVQGSKIGGILTK